MKVAHWREPVLVEGKFTPLLLCSLEAFSWGVSNRCKSLRPTFTAFRSGIAYCEKELVNWLP